MNDAMTFLLSALPSVVLTVVAMALAGLLVGLVYFAALHHTVRRFTGGGWLAPVLLTLGRIALVVVLLIVAARLGALTLLAAFAGFVVARAIAVRRGLRAFPPDDAGPEAGDRPGADADRLAEGVD